MSKHAAGTATRRWGIGPAPLLAPLLGLLLLATAPATVAADEPNLRRTHVVEVFDAHRDAVVNVNTTTIVRERFGLFESDPFFRDLFRSRPFERDIRRTSLGSGFVIHEDGYIVTNAHVVDGADEIDVTLASGDEMPARVLASDPRQDLAVLQVEVPEGLTLQRAQLGDSSDLMIGEPVVAIGNPLGYEHSVTAGIVSALNRSLPIGRDWELSGLLQTDASINPGNSGGPLINAYGQVIGIATAIRGDAQNIGFAIPVDRLRELVPELLSPLAHNGVELGGRVVEVRSIEPPSDLNVRLFWTSEDTDEGRIELTHINGHRVNNIVDAYVALLEGAEVGDPITLEGDGVIRQVFAERPQLDDAQRVVRSAMGVTPAELEKADRRRLQLEGVAGVLVVDVDRGSPAARGGLRPGDVIAQVGRHRVSNVDELALLLSQATEGTRADVYIIREGHLGMTRLTLRAPQLD